MAEHDSNATQTSDEEEAQRILVESAGGIYCLGSAGFDSVNRTYTPDPQGKAFLEDMIDLASRTTIKAEE